MDKHQIQDIFSLQWFNPAFITELHWEKPLALLLIPGIPLLFFLRWLFHFNFRRKFPIALHPNQFENLGFTSLLRTIPFLLFNIFLFFTIIALARPQSVDKNEHQISEGISIMLLLDISESMQLEDFKPNRLESAKDICKTFIEKRPDDKIGLAIFASEAFSLAPLSRDSRFLISSLENVNFKMIEGGGTAIGNAIAVGINRLREDTAKSKVIILISDGENTAGNLHPEVAAKVANAYGVKIYTIGIGKDGILPFGKDKDGNPIFVKSAPDEKLLVKVAEISDGKYYRAKNKTALQNIFHHINELEKTPVYDLIIEDREDIYQIYLMWGLIFFLLWLFSKSSFLANSLED